MEVIVIAVIASLTLIIMALVYKSRTASRRQQQRLTDRTTEIATQNNLTWNYTDFGLHRAMAWNADKRMFLFVDILQEKERMHLIHMNDIEHCRLSEKANEAQAGNKSADRHITQVSLDFIYKDKNAEPVMLQFYNELHDGLFEKAILTQKAKNWKDIIAR